MARPDGLTWWEKVAWVLRDPWTNELWAETREHRLAREAFTRR